MNSSKHIRQKLESSAEIQLVYIFGSVLTSNSHAESDIDIAILIDESFWKSLGDTLEYESELIVMLQHLFESDRIDLVLLNSAPPLLANEVISTGKLLYYDEPLRINNFIVRTKQRYLDTKPLRAIKRQYLYARIDRGEFSQVAEP